MIYMQSARRETVECVCVERERERDRYRWRCLWQPYAGSGDPILASIYACWLCLFVSGPIWGRSCAETMVDNWTTKIRQPFLVRHAHQSRDRTLRDRWGKGSQPMGRPSQRDTRGHPPPPPLCLPHSFTRSLCLSHTNEELMMWTIIVKINSIRGYSGLKKLPVMTCWISESKTETEVKAESERGFCCGKRGSLVRHRLCVFVCVCTLSCRGSGARQKVADNGYTCAPLLYPASAPAPTPAPATGLSLCAIKWLN